MPTNAISPKMNLIAAGDIAKEHVKITTVREGVLTTVSELRLPKDEEEDFDEGSVHKLPSEVLTKRHTVLVAGERKDKIAEGMEFSDYLLNSTKISSLKLFTSTASLLRLLQSLLHSLKLT